MLTMKKVCSFLWIVSLFIFCTVAVLELSADFAGAADVPNGTYKRTCTNILYDPASDTITMARCRRINGSWNVTRFDNCRQCKGDIENCNGEIQCTGVNIPNGSYKKSCFCCRMVGATLNCFCKPRKGASRYTALNNAANYTTIWNEDGSLRGK